MERKLIDLNDVLGPKLSHKVPSLGKKLLGKVLHLKEINSLIATTDQPSGLGFFNRALEFLDISYTLQGAENIDPSRKLLFVGNHPMGGPEGLIMGSVLQRFFGKKFRVPVNSLLGNFHPIKEFFIPVSVFGHQSKEAATKLNEAFASDNQVMMYPAGACAKLVDGRVREMPWKKTFVTQARRYHRDVVPMHMSSHNSKRYFFLSRLSKWLHLKFNLGMIFLVDELFKKRHSHLTISFGKPIPWDTFDQSKSDQEWVELVRTQTVQLQRASNCEPNM